MQLKKLCSVLLAGLLLAIGTALPVYADNATEAGTEADTFDDGVVYYVHVDGGVEVYGCDPNTISLKLMDTIDGYKIIGITDGAFYGCSKLQTVELGKNIQKIGESAFMECTSLKKIAVPETVEEIGNYAFYGCTSLETVSLPDHIVNIPEGMFYGCEVLQNPQLSDELESIGNAAFYGCTLMETFPFAEPLTSIGDYAFGNCYSLQEVVLPATVETIGSASFSGCMLLKDFTVTKNLKDIGVLAFWNCLSIAEFTVEEGNANYAAKDGVLYSKDGKTLYSYPLAKEGTQFLIPEGVETIYDGAFFGAALEEIHFPSTLVNVGAGAFEYCESIQAIALPEGTKYIYENAFADCTALVALNLPESLEGVGNYAFYACPKLKNVTLPENCKTVGEYAFGYTDGTETDENGSPIPVKIEGFHLTGGGVDVMKIVWIVVGVAAVLVIAFFLIRVIRKNQLTKEEAEALADEEEAADLTEEDAKYQKILDQMDTDAESDES